MATGPVGRAAPGSPTVPLTVGIDSHNAEFDGEGNATYAHNLIGGLYAAPGDERYTLLAGDPAHPFYGSLPGRPGSRAIRVAQGGGLLRIALTLGRAAARARVDCLHVQYAAPLAWRRPLVVSVHDLGFLHVPETFPRPLRAALSALVPLAIRRAARVATCSEFCRRDIESRYGAARGKVAVIPLGAARAFRPRAPAETAAVLARHGLAPGFVFSLGRLNRRKNLERLLLAYGRARAPGAAEAPRVIGGKADFGVREVLERARLAGDPSPVRFTGLIPDADLPHFYAGAACFVYPSLFEGFGLPVLEAMACGTPVIASDRTALPELVGDAGLLVDPERVDAIAEAVAALLADGDRARALGQRALERSRRFSWEETARRTLDLYRAAAGC